MWSVRWRAAQKMKFECGRKVVRNNTGRTLKGWKLRSRMLPQGGKSDVKVNKQVKGRRL